MKKVYRRKDTPVAKQGTGPAHLVMPAIEGIGENEELEEEEEEEEVEVEEQQEKEHETKATESDVRRDPLFLAPSPSAPPHPSSSPEEKPRIMSASGFHGAKDDRVVTSAVSEIDRRADGGGGATDGTVRAQPDDNRRGVTGDGMVLNLSSGSGECCPRTEGGGGGVDDAGGGDGGGGGSGDGDCDGGGLVQRFSSSGSLNTQHSRLSEHMTAVDFNGTSVYKTKFEGVVQLQTISSQLHQPPDEGREKDADNAQNLTQEETTGVGEEPDRAPLKEQVSPVQSQADERSSFAGSKVASGPAKGSSAEKWSQAAAEDQDLGGTKLGHASLNTCHASLISQPSSCSSPATCQRLHKDLRSTKESSGGQPSSPGSSGGIKNSPTTTASSSDGGHYGGVRPKTARVLHRKNTPAVLPKVENLYATRAMLSSDRILSEEPVEDEE